MEERQEEGCTCVATYSAWSGLSSGLEDYDHVFSKSSMGYFGEKL